MSVAGDAKTAEAAKKEIIVNVHENAEFSSELGSCGICGKFQKEKKVPILKEIGVCKACVLRCAYTQLSEELGVSIGVICPDKYMEKSDEDRTCKICMVDFLVGALETMSVDEAATTEAVMTCSRCFESFHRKCLAKCGPGGKCPVCREATTSLTI